MRCVMSEGRRIAVAAFASVFILTASACDRPAESPPPATAAAATSASSAAPGAAAGTPGMPGMPHGDHNPHHGGIVMMKGEMHYEVVVDPTGRMHQLFFTDATREDLPASVASSVTLTIHRPNAADEAIPLQIDESGESWTGSGHPIAEGAGTTVRVAFTINSEPYWIDLPLK
jgi:hypothetical protein